MDEQTNRLSATRPACMELTTCGCKKVQHCQMRMLKAIPAWEFVTRSCLKPQNPCSNDEIHVLFEHGCYLKKPKPGPDLHA